MDLLIASKDCAETKELSRGVLQAHDMLYHHEEVEEEDELFEIDLELLNSIPPSQYYFESYFTTMKVTKHALLANCLLPITALSSAIPISSLPARSSGSIVILTKSAPNSGNEKLIGFELPSLDAVSMILN